LTVEKTINGDPVVQQLPDCPFCGKDFRCWLILWTLSPGLGSESKCINFEEVFFKYL
jgi:hypothetical protein